MNICLPSVLSRRLFAAFVVLFVLTFYQPSANARGEPDFRQRLNAVSDLLQQQVDSGKLSGAVTMAAQHGKVLHLKSIGLQDVENRVPMTTDTIFRIFSMTKPIAGTALMMLYDQGRFKLSDPVEKYIPEFRNLQVAKQDGPDGMPITEPMNHPMTIRELMSHSGGLTYGFFSQSQVDTLYVKANVMDRNSTLKEMILKLSNIPLWAQPGTKWQYSVSADVQGYLVEVLSKIPFDKYLEEKIFKPLGMIDTAFYVPADKAPRLARYYKLNRSGKLVSEPNKDYLQEPVLLSGGGGLVSTVSDYMRFARMHLNGGELDGVRILSKKSAQLMRQKQLDDTVNPRGNLIGNGNTFGLDFAIVNDSARAANQPEGNYWWWGIAGTWFWIDPRNDFIFIGMIQTRDVRRSIGLHNYSKRLIYKDPP